MTTLHSRLAALACCAAMMSACAAQAYNPDNLPSDQLTRVSGICTAVMGLSPNEPLEGGYWLGNDRLDYYTNHYRGCIVSLSDSLQYALDQQLTQGADADCRAKSLQSGSPDLALCALNSVNTTRKHSRQAIVAVSAITVSHDLPAASGSFFYASPHENARREQTTCAALGLSPSNNVFKSCVTDLNDTFYAIDHPIN